MTRFCFFTAVLIAIFMSPANTETPELSGWELIWSDEFGGSKLDLSKWTYDVDCWGGGNNERQCYTDKEQNVKLEDGFLKITALKKYNKLKSFFLLYFVPKYPIPRVPTILNKPINDKIIVADQPPKPLSCIYPGTCVPTNVI